MIAAAAAAGDHTRYLQPHDLYCINAWPPPYPGYREEIRAIAARGGEPGPIASSAEHTGYLFNNSRMADSHYTMRDVGHPGPRVPEGMSGATKMMTMAAIINWQVAPPGQCVWEHEYVAWGGNLTGLEYDADLRCYLADGPAGAPAPYELADAETRALVERAGPAPSGAGAFECYGSPKLCVEPAPNGTAAFEYVLRNTRPEVYYGPGPSSGDPYPEVFYRPGGLLSDAHIPRPRVLYGAEHYAAEALFHTGGDAYRAVKMLNRDFPLLSEECVREALGRPGAEACRTWCTRRNTGATWRLPSCR